MALTPATWYNGVVVQPSWFQSVQNLYNLGTTSVYSLYADGVGGAAVTAPPAGTIQIGATGSGTATPTPTPTANCIYQEMMPRAWMHFTTPGTFDRGFNISSVSRTSAGVYVVTLITAMPSTKYVIMGTTTRNQTTIQYAITSSTVFNFQMSDSATGVSTDPGAFALAVIG